MIEVLGLGGEERYQFGDRAVVALEYAGAGRRGLLHAALEKADEDSAAVGFRYDRGHGPAAGPDDLYCQAVG